MTYKLYTRRGNITVSITVSTVAAYNVLNRDHLDCIVGVAFNNHSSKLYRTLVSEIVLHKRLIPTVQLSCNYFLLRLYVKRVARTRNSERIQSLRWLRARFRDVACCRQRSLYVIAVREGKKNREEKRGTLYNK